MSKRLKRKSTIIFVVGLIAMILMGVFLTVMQSTLSLENQQADMETKLQQIDDLVKASEEDTKQTTETYDAIYQSKAESLVYLATNLEGFKPTNSLMKEYRELLDVTNVLVLDREGNQVAKARNTVADFTYPRYNQLRTVFSTGEPSEAFEVEVEDAAHRYYGAKIDAEHMFVVEQDSEELSNDIQDTSTWEGVLKNVSVGEGGYALVISDATYTFTYHPQEDLVGQDALDAGVSVESLEDKLITRMTIDGEKLYCGVTHVDDAYVVCAIPEKEILASRNVTVIMLLFIFFAVMTIIVTYGIFVWREEEAHGCIKDEEVEENPVPVVSTIPEEGFELEEGPEPEAESRQKAENPKKSGGFFYNKVIGRKTATLTIIGVIAILVISFYLQTLFVISKQAVSNEQHIAEVEQTVAQNEEMVAQLTEEYNTRYLNKCQIAAYALNRNPALINREKLAELRDVLQIQYVNVFGASGEQIESSSPFLPFHVSQDPEAQSYDFNKLLYGEEYLIQEAQNDEALNEFHQYIGVSLKDENNNANGFVQIAVRPFRLQNMLASTTVDKVLDGIKVGTEGFAFAVNKEDKTFAYYPETKYIGRDAAEYGMEEGQFTDGYCDYITIDGEKYYGSSLATDNYYIYVVVPEKEMGKNCLPIALASTGLSLLFLLIIFVILAFAEREESREESMAAEDDEDRMIEIEMPDGRMSTTETADSRWKNITIDWNEKTAEQKLGSVLRALWAVLAITICLGVIFKDTAFSSTNTFAYVLSGKWERQVNIFAITGCIIIICVISVATMAIKKVLSMLSKTFGARGETVCRLIISFLKYVSVIAMLYYCFALFGVDTKTLLASAGILSLVIGLGAKTLVSDILAGLFIIFEGEFRVGDIVTIGDWRGTVVEIGVRTTKIEDGGKNVKIISNSNVSGVINMTKRFSYAFCDVGIEYGESLERVENILEKEFPNIKRRLPAIEDGPFYKGVVSLGDNSVNIRILAQCAEGDRIQLVRDLNREMKLVFDKYDINIPFPQVVLNQPTEFAKASLYEKMRADQFNEKQKEASKEMGKEDR